MQLFAVIAVVCATIIIAEAKLSDEQKVKLRTYHKDCLTSTKVDPVLVTKARAGEFQDVPELKEYTLCMGKKIGFVDETGSLQETIIVNKLGSVLDDNELAKKLTETCAVTKPTPQETTFEIVKCFYEKSPKHTLII